MKYNVVIFKNSNANANANANSNTKMHISYHCNDYEDNN